MPRMSVRADQLQVGDRLVTFGWTINEIRGAGTDTIGLTDITGKIGTAFPAELDVEIDRPGDPSLIAEWRQAASVYAGRAEEPLLPQGVRMQLNATAATYGMCADQLAARLDAIVTRWEKTAETLEQGPANGRQLGVATGLRTAVFELRGLL